VLSLCPRGLIGNGPGPSTVRRNTSELSVKPLVISLKRRMDLQLIMRASMRGTALADNVIYWPSDSRHDFRQDGPWRDRFFLRHRRIVMICALSLQSDKVVFVIGLLYCVHFSPLRHLQNPPGTNAVEKGHATLFRRRIMVSDKVHTLHVATYPGCSASLAAFEVFQCLRVRDGSAVRPQA